jgi:putative ABC transport system ATP-binding protein
MSEPFRRAPLTPAPLISARGVDHTFGSGETAKRVLTGIGIEVRAGELVILTGPSGSGKTTLLTLVGALRSVQAGSLVVLGRELRGLPSAELIAVRRKIGFIFQAHNLFESLDAQENVRLALELEHAPGPQNDARARAILERVGLGHRVHYKPGALSGGQRQRVAVARALVNDPALVLADEPTAALDEKAGREVVTIFQEIARAGRSVVMVSHDSRVLDVADRIVNMVDGRIVSDVRARESVRLCELLKKCSVFAPLSATELAEVAQNVTKQVLPEGATIVRQGDSGDRFYVLETGTASVSVASGEDREVVARLGPGDFFGEAALLTGQPRNATVEAVSDVALYSLSKPHFLSALDRSATFKEQLLKVFFQRQ